MQSLGKLKAKATSIKSRHLFYRHHLANLTPFWGNVPKPALFRKNLAKTRLSPLYALYVKNPNLVFVHAKFLPLILDLELCTEEQASL